MSESHYRDQQVKLGKSFGAVADHYGRARPSYPIDCIDPATVKGKKVVEIAAGTGALTKRLSSLDPALLIPTDLSVQMLQDLQRSKLKVEPFDMVATKAEDLSFPDGMFDTIFAAQAAHWFDIDRSTREFSRILGSQGKLVLIWNIRDGSVPWVSDFDRVVDSYQNRIVIARIVEEITGTKRFSSFSRTKTPFVHRLDPELARSLIMSFSPVSTLDSVDRERVVEAALGILMDNLDSEGKISIPYVANVYTSTVL
ncbi:methyltransferase domain-containing protein [Acidithrix sp. C25]|uniref:class I SAM-dependent methyltransferase n=1 Tax=Acidithrix sp. C25 TaxID=1671482 RepID=UPI00191B9D87|nr:methyltransferase domain-containing protein [Acidithrix sp. C25]CAG4931462.1 unnamed protein product [Acidithrix sp. C25]